VAERLIELDGLNERGWCLAMDAEGALGNRQAILDRYERLSRELGERLGLLPGAEAKDTYRRLLGQS
jgi:DNA-binding SARP family transcriptional activator